MKCFIKKQNQRRLWMALVLRGEPGARIWRRRKAAEWNKPGWTMEVLR